jgi:tetratricopeptide (TPR) repeat protein
MSYIYPILPREEIVHRFVSVAPVLCTLMGTYASCIAFAQNVSCPFEPYDQSLACYTAHINFGRLAGESLATALSNRGGSYLRKGEFDRAMTDFDRAISLYPIAAPWRWHILNGRRETYRAKGNLDRAIADFSEALRTPDPNADTADILFFRGRTYYEKGDLDRANR